MSKQTRKGKREEERRILAEFDEALAKEREQAKDDSQVEHAGKKSSRESFYDSTQPQNVHCRRCKTLMEGGVCPVCGYKTYQPMSEEKRKKIRNVLTVVLVGVFVVLFVITQLL